MFIWNLFSGIILGCMVGRGIRGEIEGNNRYAQGRRVIDTNHGKVQGLLVSFPNKKIKPVEVYLGLQYASLLGSRLRFMPPTNPVEKWKGLRLAMKHRAACPQRRLDKEELRKTKPEAVADYLSHIASFTRHQTEDCLSLNIYVPTKEENDTMQVPVMVFIHGESYESGTGNAYDGSVLASFGRVIVITLNYRLGVLGYLTAGENTNIASGNYALLDIIAALHWVKENIANFTGDPGKVTLFGHGYGAALVNLLLVSPLTKDGKLFQRGIVQSGSALSSWAVAKEPVECTRMLAESVNCSQHMNNAQSLVSCLRKLSTDDLMKVVPKSPKYFNCFAPSVSTRSSVIPHPVEILHQSADSVFGKGSLMFGLTKNEAVDYLTQDEIVDGLSALRKAQIIRTYVHNTFKYHRQKVYEILDHHYTEWDRNINNRSRRDAVMELLTDGQYVAPLIKVGNYHESQGNTYFYSFTHSTKSESYPRLSGGIHGDELPYVFGAPLVEKLAPFQISEYSRAERMLSEAMMTYWTNFAKSGDPNAPMSQKLHHAGRSHSRFVDLVWLGYDDKNQTYLQITMRPKLGSHYRGRQLALWLDLIPKIHKSDGADPKEHLLKDYHNMTTFDSPERLLHIDSLFPPPTTTTDKSMQTMATERTDGTTYSFGNRWPQGSITHQNYEQEVTVAPPEQQPVDGKNITSAGSSAVMGDHSVQVSITIAVGCSLLFLNILIFAGIYYQRERIKKLKKPNGEPEGLRLNRKPEEENSRSNGPETISLLSTPITQSPQVGHLKADPGCCPPQSSFKTPSSSTYVPMHKLPSFSSSQPKGHHVSIGPGPHVITGPGPHANMGPGPHANMSPSSQVINQLQSNHRLGQVSVHHGKPLDHIESNSEVTIV